MVTNYDSQFMQHLFPQEFGIPRDAHLERLYQTMYREAAERSNFAVSELLVKTRQLQHNYDMAMDIPIFDNAIRANGGEIDRLFDQMHRVGAILPDIAGEKDINLIIAVKRVELARVRAKLDEAFVAFERSPEGKKFLPYVEEFVSKGTFTAFQKDHPPELEDAIEAGRQAYREAVEEGKAGARKLENEIREEAQRLAPEVKKWSAAKKGWVGAGVAAAAAIAGWATYVHNRDKSKDKAPEQEPSAARQ